MVRHQVAANQGRAVGSTIAGKAQPFVKVPIFWSARASFLLLLFIFYRRT